MTKNVIDDKVISSVNGGNSPEHLASAGEEFAAIGNFSEEQLARLALARDKDDLKNILAKEYDQELTTEQLLILLAELRRRGRPH